MSEVKKRFIKYNLHGGTGEDAGMVKCPVCGKLFLPAAEHVYKKEGYRGGLVCTYSCMRKDQKAKEARRR